MANDNATGVHAAFEMLLEEIEAEVEAVDAAGASAFQVRKRDAVLEALERAERMEGFRAKVLSLREEWEAIAGTPVDSEAGLLPPAVSPRPAKLRAGLRTPEEPYFRPILQSLADMGGAGDINAVLARVKDLMKGVLKPVDYEPIASDPDTPRWRNTGAWARRSLVKQGLLKEKSRRGIWEITDAGRAFLGQCGR